MGMRIDGGAALLADLQAQKARLRDPQPALDQASRELEALRRAHPRWNRPGSWLRRARELVLAYVARGSVR